MFFTCHFVGHRTYLLDDEDTIGRGVSLYPLVGILAIVVRCCGYLQVGTFWLHPDVAAGLPYRGNDHLHAICHLSDKFPRIIHVGECRQRLCFGGA